MRILIVDDSELIGRKMRLLAEQMNIQVDHLLKAFKAWEFYNNNHEFIDGVVLDLFMPSDLDGLDLAYKLRMINPGVRILFCTGYDIRADEKRGRELLRLGPVLQKPFFDDSFRAELIKLLHIEQYR